MYWLYHLQFDIRIYHIKRVRHLIQTPLEGGWLSHNVRRRSMSGDESVAVDESRKVGYILEALRLKLQRINFVSPNIPRDTPQKISFRRRFPALLGFISLYAAKWSLEKTLEFQRKLTNKNDFESQFEANFWSWWRDSWFSTRCNHRLTAGEVSVSPFKSSKISFAACLSAMLI